MNTDYYYQSLYLEDVNHFISNGFPLDTFHRLGRGIKPIGSVESLRLYNALYAGHHIAKFKVILPFCSNYMKKDTRYTVVDWGCGQGLAASMLIDYLKSLNMLGSIENVILIEPSYLATNRAVEILNKQLYQSHLSNSNIFTVNKRFEYVDSSDIRIHQKSNYIHLFSNALDTNIESINNVMRIIKNIEKSSLIAATSPNYPLTVDAYQKMKDYLLETNIEEISNDTGIVTGMIYLLKYRRWSHYNISYNQSIIKLNNNE